MIHLSSASKIKYRCEILKHNCHVENAVGWLNELFLEQFTKNEHRDALSDAFVDLLVHASAFPAKKWINDFIILIQNKTIEREVSEGLKFFLDMFIVAIVCMSGYYAVTNKRDIYGSRYRLFGQSLQLFSSRDINTDIIGDIFEFIIYALNQPAIPTDVKNVFKSAIKLCKNNCYFKKSKPWQNFLDTLLS